MTSRAVPVLAAVGLMVLAGVARAEAVYLRNGSVLQGRVLALDDETVAIELADLPGSRVEIPLARVSDYGLFALKLVRAPDTVGGHARLGDWAMGKDLFALAMEQYADAVKLAGDDVPAGLRGKLEDASARCGADKLARARRLIEAERLVEARDFLRDVLRNHPTCPAAGPAREIVGRLDERIRARRDAGTEEAATRGDASAVEEGLALAADLVDRGQRLRKLGLEQSGELARAEDDFEAAVDAYRRARSILERLRDEHGVEPEKLRDRTARIDRLLGDAYVDLGHNHIVKGNLVRANHYMGLALALDPNDPNALALRRTIALATGQDRWGSRR